MFKTFKEFSMGDCSALRGSEIILRIAALVIQGVPYQIGQINRHVFWTMILIHCY